MARSRRTARQEDLLTRLVALVAAEGFEGFTLDMLAARLNCSKTTLYALADSKHELVVEAVKHFFLTATDGVEASAARIDDPVVWIEAYLAAIGEHLRPLSRAFMDDLAGFGPANDVYRRNTALAANRIREEVSRGVSIGVFRQVHAAFAAEAIAVTMAEIQAGSMTERLGMSHADAYAELAALVVHGLVD